MKANAGQSPSSRPLEKGCAKGGGWNPRIGRATYEKVVKKRKKNLLRRFVPQ